MNCGFHNGPKPVAIGQLPRRTGIHTNVSFLHPRTPVTAQAATDFAATVDTQKAEILSRQSSQSKNGFQGLVQQLWSQFGELWVPRDAEGLIETFTEGRDGANDMIDGKDKDAQLEAEEKSRKAVPNIFKFLKPAQSNDVKVLKFMSSLTCTTYQMATITPCFLWRRYRLSLVTTSLTCKQPAEDSAKVEQAMLLSDGMTVSGIDISCQNDAVESTFKESNIVTAEDLRNMKPLAKKEQPWSGTTKAMVDMTRTAATSVGLAVTSAAGTLSQQALIQLAQQVRSAAYSGQTAILDSVTKVLSLVHVALNFRPEQGKVLSETVTANQGARIAADDGQLSWANPPCEWFVADHLENKLRIFAIQGTDSMETWQVNLSFDPVVFEDASLGVRVHRGAYEVAHSFYELFKPMVVEHLETSPDAKIAFTGHSIGGSLSMILMLMFVHRGVLPPNAVHGVYTFGAPAMFCEGGGKDCANCALAAKCGSTVRKERVQNRAGGLLNRLGLPSASIMNVVMHRDVVPRAFACDYSIAVPLLRSWAPFRDHGCLGGLRALLYNFIGEVLVLQPSEKSKFVKGEGYHSMIPQGSGLYFVSDATRQSEKMARDLKKKAEKNGLHFNNDVGDRREAFLSLMDCPHPLEMLADAGSYGGSGSISRYHNPHHYTQGLRSVLVDRQLSQLENIVRKRVKLGYKGFVSYRYSSRAVQRKLPVGASCTIRDNRRLRVLRKKVRVRVVAHNLRRARRSGKRSHK